MLSNYYINKNIPHNIRSQFIAPISRSYEVIEKIKAEFPLLNGPMLSNTVADLRQTLIEHELIRMINHGLIEGLKCKTSNNKRKNHPFLEIYNESFIATVSHVKNHKYLPRRALFRNERAANNQISFFDEDNVDPSKLYFIITHGHNGVKPHFICLGLPDGNNKFWVERINIMSEPYMVSSKQEEEESLVSLTQFAKEVLKIEADRRE